MPLLGEVFLIIAVNLSICGYWIICRCSA